MDTFTAIETRRSVKYFDPQHRMTEAEIQHLIALAMLSPTAFNLQHWRFVTVHDPALRQQIRTAAHDQEQVTDASLLLVLCADLKAWRRYPERCWSNAPQQVRDYMLPTIDQFYRYHEQAQHDECLRSCGIAAQTVMLTARAMGYDSCPMVGFDFDAVAKLINLPDDHLISMFIVIGRALKAAQPRPGQLAMDEVLLVDGFPVAP
ncbi:MAG: nitroreductase family protein [Gammaproteobacteria bacterium]|nr:nitroreductase family protein [Gammaproteobacteria bacterium]